MGVGLYIHHGTYDSATTPDDWLAGVRDWFDEDLDSDPFWGHFLTPSRTGATHDDRPAVFVQIHPAAEEVEFIVAEPGKVLVSAKTSTVGPGYHTALCRLLHRFGDEKGVTWNPAGDADDSSHDESGYFFTGDRDAVEREMLLHLKTIAVISADSLKATGHTLEAWHMPIGHSSEYPGGVRTPMGVRSDEWVRAVAADPRNGRDIYPWWDEGLTAGFFRGRGVHEMWLNVRWREILNDEEYDAWDSTCSDLCEAYKLDPTLDFPWREWAELIDMLDDFEGASAMTEELSAIVRERAAQVPADRPLIGYRRFPVKVSLLDGWTITIPGAMTEKWEEAVWSAWDGDRTVWFSNWGITNKGVPVPAEQCLAAMKLPDPDAEVIPHRDGDLVGKAHRGTCEEDDDELLSLRAYSAVDGKAALCNVYFRDESDFEWALRTWHSLNAPPDKGGGEP
jgi:hypothetical protein